MTLVPQIAVHGALTVPEFWATSLAFWGVTVVVTDGEPRDLIFAALAIAAATLCRYEAWPLAVFCVGYSAWGQREPRKLLATLLGCSGMALWLLFWLLTAKDAFGFTHGLAEYREALGEGGEPLLWKLLRFPMLAFLTAPELTLLLLVSWWQVRAGSTVQEQLIPMLQRFALPVACLLGFLVLSNLRNTMATHHLERPVLFTFLLRGLLAGVALHEAFTGPFLRSRVLTTSLCAILAGLACRPLTPHYTWYHPRPEEVALGRRLRTFIEPHERVPIQTAPYAHFAIMAGLGYPRRTALLFTEDTKASKKTWSQAEWRVAAQKRSNDESAPWIVAPRARLSELQGWATVRLVTNNYVVANSRLRPRHGH